MAAYDLADWVSRFVGLLPKEWFSSSAITGGGVLYAFMSGELVNLPFHKTQVNYAALQTRLITATDNNLDLIANDFFGTGQFPRIPFTESDDSYRLRIKLAIGAPKTTIPAIQAAVDYYFLNQYQPPAGSPRPTALVFDAMTGPGALAQNYSPGGNGFWYLNQGTVGFLGRSSYLFNGGRSPLFYELGLYPPEFVVLISVPMPSDTPWFLNRDPVGFLGRSSYLVNTNDIIIYSDSPDAGLKAIVDEEKAAGTIPVYASQRSIGT